MTDKDRISYYCFECKFAKSGYGVLRCTMLRGITNYNNKACADFKIKKGFKSRKYTNKKKKRAQIK